MSNMKWTAKPVELPHPSVPVLLNTPSAWALWAGRSTDEETLGALEGACGAVTIDDVAWAVLEGEQGVFHLGVNGNEVVLLTWFGPARKLAAHKAKLAAGGLDEFLTGVLDVVDGLVLGNAWTRGWTVEAPKVPKKVKQGDESLFVVPLASGRYVVLEGHDEACEESRWLRILPGDLAAYVTRPKAEPREIDPADLAREILHEIETPRVTGKQLVAATSTFDHIKRIVALDQRSMIAQRIMALSTSRPAYARWLDVLLRAATGADAVDRLSELATEWLAAPTSTHSANQHISRIELLSAFDALEAVGVQTLAPLRAKVEAAPQPDVFVEEGDFF